MKGLEREDEQFFDVLERGELLVGHTDRSEMVKAGGSTVAAAAFCEGEREQN